MAQRFCFVPIIQTDVYRNPAHFGGRGLPPDVGLGRVSYSMMDYGFVPVGLVSADLNAAQVTYLTALTDVIMLPANLDNTITAGQIPTIRTRLDDFNIPSAWVNVGDTYRAATREIIGFFQVMQRYSALISGNPFGLGVNLSTPIGSVAFNQWSTMNDRWQVLKSLTVTQDIKDESGNVIGSQLVRQYTDEDAFFIMKGEALSQGLSIANFLRAALIITLVEKQYNISQLTENTTLNQILTGLSKQNDNRVFTIGGVNF